MTHSLTPRPLRLWVAVLAACLAVSGCGSDSPEPARSPTTPTQLESLERVDDAEADRLRALGYLDVVEAGSESLELGVLYDDPERASSGLVHFTNAHGCSAVVMRRNGEVVRRWQGEPCHRWGNSVVLPDGGLLVVHRDPPRDGSAAAIREARVLMRMDRDGEVLWSRRMPAHHDADWTPRGQIATLTYEHRIIPDIHPTVAVRDHGIAILSTDGELLEEVSMTDLLESSPEVFRLRMVQPHHKDEIDEIDLLHSNSLEWIDLPNLAALSPLYAPSNLLLSIRHQDVVVIVDWDRKKVVWAWGRGEISGPHDATMLPNGNVLVFDNGLRRQWSRVVEVDPRTNRIVWEYRAEEPRSFFTYHRGAAQRLPNGNTMITDSGAGRAFEVDREGEIVWDFRNPTLSQEGQPIVLVRTRRLPEESLSVDRPVSRVD